MAAADARYLNPTGLMDARRFFSQVVVAPRGTTVYVAGQTGFRADRSIAPTKEGQMVQAFANVKIALEAAQARMDQVVSMTVYIVGKRWMWKAQHGGGQREINELHVPVGVPVRLTLTSEDVIHSFFVPAFRIKKDAVPGRYTMAWFQATKTGEFEIGCAELCGMGHYKMRARVFVHTPEDYEKWAAENIKAQAAPPAQEEKPKS